MQNKLSAILVVAVMTLVLSGCALIPGGTEEQGTQDDNGTPVVENTGSVCERITGKLSGGITVTDASDDKACFFNYSGVEYGVIDLRSSDAAAEFSMAEGMYGASDVETVQVTGAEGAFWSDGGNILLVRAGERIITINNSSNNKDLAVSIANTYLN